jgi:hypothetical protein
MEVIKEACERGVVVVAISQCAKGTVSDAYETGRTLLDTGVVAGGDMTPEVSILIRYQRTGTEVLSKVCPCQAQLPVIEELTGIETSPLTHRRAHSRRTHPPHSRPKQLIRPGQEHY